MLQVEVLQGAPEDPFFTVSTPVAVVVDHIQDLKQ